MKNFIVYTVQGQILRTGVCQNKTFHRQANEDQGELVMEGEADDALQKVVDGKIVDKTPGEIKTDDPPLPEIPVENQPARITNEQWQNVLDRLRALEGG